MLPNLYFIFDTNTLISAHLLLGSVSFRALNLARRIGIIACTEETFEEFSQSFSRDKFEKYLSIKKRKFDIAEIKSFIEFFRVKFKVSVCRDPDDDKFLSLAEAANAACIVTGDKDLLILSPYKDIPILNPAQFLSYFEEYDNLFMVNEPIEHYGNLNVVFR
jgi:putative PIN family toxin of toxin-antitoxin system